MTILSLLAIMLISPSKADISEGFLTPYVAFEFAKTESDLHFLSGDGPSAIANREKLQSALHWDMVFPVAFFHFSTSSERVANDFIGWVFPFQS